MSGIPEGYVAVQKGIPAGYAPVGSNSAQQQANYDTLQNDTQELRIGPFNTGIQMSPEVTETLAGAGRRMAQIGTFGTHDNTHPAAEQALDNSPYALGGSIAADVAAIPLGGAALKTASAAPVVGRTLGAIGQGLTRPKSALQGAAALGTYGAATSPNRTEGAAGGAVGGALGYAAPKVLGSVVKPQLQKGAQVLRDKGINLTPGELLGGIMQRVEDGLVSMPLIGDLIRSAKGRSLTSWNKSLINDALKVIGSKIDDAIPAGREAIAAADDVISKKYDDVLDGMTLQLDDTLNASLDKLAGMAKSLPKKEARQFKQYLEDKVYRAFGGDDLVALGRTYKGLASDLRTAYKALEKAPSYYQRQLGAAYREVHIALKEAASRQNPAKGEALQAADQAYAMMGRISDASIHAGAKEGVFTPAHLVASVKKAATTKRQFAKGRAYGQSEADAAKSILPATVPDSGTPFRAITGAATVGGAGLVGAPALAALGAGAGLYTKPGQALAQALIGRRPPIAGPVRQGLEEVAPYSALLGSMLGVQSGQ